MNRHPLRRSGRELGTAWFIFSLLAACATLLALVLIGRPASLAQAVQAPAATAPAAYVGSDPSLPAASSVFKDGESYVPGLPVETF